MEQLKTIQKQLKANKNQFNSFGGYKYRSCEDILESIKPLLGNAILTLTDDIVLIGDRYYVKATARITDGEKFFSVTAYARESLDKKGMDSSQITGAASSYARKYALNGLFLIDDNKDADSMDNTQKEEKPEKSTKLKPDDITQDMYNKLTEKQREAVRNYYATKQDLPFMGEDEFKIFKNWK